MSEHLDAETRRLALAAINYLRRQLAGQVAPVPGDCHDGACRYCTPTAAGAVVAVLDRRRLPSLNMADDGGLRVDPPVDDLDEW